MGGWNGANLSKLLSDKGYHVTHLITLDPVGLGAGIKVIANINKHIPNPKADQWIYIGTDPKDYAADDFIADMGEQCTTAVKIAINEGFDYSAISKETQKPSGLLTELKHFVTSTSSQHKGESTKISIIKEEALDWKTKN